MNFLNPIGLLALLTIPPVILLYLLRLQRIPVKVPSILLWRRMVQDMQANQPFQRLRFSILLLLQIIVLLLTAFAFARPYFQTREPSGRSIVVILDASLSMQAKDVPPSRFEAAKAEALKIASSLESADEMMVIAAGGLTRVLTSFTRDVGTLRRAIDSAKPSDCRSNLREALALSVSLAREKANTVVYLLSDGAGGQPVDLSVPDNVQVRYMPFGTRCKNVAVTGLNVRETFTANSRYQLFVSVRNYCDEQVDCQVEVLLNGDLINVQALHLAPKSQVQHIIEDAKLAGGIIEARVDYADDVEADNVARVVFRERAKRKVLLVTEGSRWLEAVLASDPVIDARTIKPAEYDPAAPDVGAFDITIFDRWSPETLPRVSCILVKTAPTGGPVVDERAPFDNPSILDWDRKHPVLRYVDLGSLAVSSMMRVKVEPWAKGIVDTAAGPLLVAGEKEDLRVLFIGFDLDHSTFPVRVGFPIFMRNAFLWLTTDPAAVEAQSYATGTPVTIRVPDGVQKVTVTRPDKTEEPVSVRPASTARRNAGSGAATEEAGSASATYDSTELAGIYRFSADGTLLDQAAFNVSDPDESDLTPRETIELAGGQKAEATAFVRSTKELWRILCVVALVLVSLEWIVYHRRVG